MRFTISSRRKVEKNSLGYILMLIMKIMCFIPRELPIPDIPLEKNIFKRYSFIDRININIINVFIFKIYVRFLHVIIMPSHRLEIINSYLKNDL